MRRPETGGEPCTVRAHPVLAAVLALLASPAAAQDRKVIVDQDARGPASTDMLSILLFLQAPDVDVLGITLVTGDQWVKEQTQRTLRAVEVAGRTDVPVCLVPSTRWSTPKRNRSGGSGSTASSASRAPGRRASSIRQTRCRRSSKVRRPPRRSMSTPRTSSSAWFTSTRGGHHLGRRTAHQRRPGAAPRSRGRDPGEGTGADGIRLQREPGRHPSDQRAPGIQLVVRPGSGPDRHERAVEEDHHHAGRHLGQDAARRGHKARSRRAQRRWPLTTPSSPTAASYMWDEIPAVAWMDPTIITSQQQLYVNIDIDHGASYGQTSSSKPRPAAGQGSRRRLARCAVVADRHGPVGPRHGPLLRQVHRADVAAAARREPAMSGMVRTRAGLGAVVAWLLICTWCRRSPGRRGRSSSTRMPPGRPAPTCCRCSRCCRRRASRCWDRRHLGRRLGARRRAQHAADAGADRPREGAGGPRRRGAAGQHARTDPAWEEQYGEFVYKGAWNAARWHEPGVCPVARR